MLKVTDLPEDDKAMLVKMGLCDLIHKIGIG